jgi:hypothetical protein
VQRDWSRADTAERVVKLFKKRGGGFGLTRSILNLATSLTLGEGGPKDEKRATDLLKQLAESASTPDDLKRIAESRLGTA